jgi:ribulose-5-phosphate 4-epimerase/fuculose-1-phosphate aldolase
MNAATEALAREMVAVCASLFARGYSYGSAGNVSARTDDIILATPTNSSLGALEAGALAELSLDGAPRNATRPTKEINFHLGIYRAVPEAKAIVHLHSTYATAFSCLADLPGFDPLPFFTPYFPMRVAAMPVVAYLPPGTQELADAITAVAPVGPVILLRNHGSVAWARDLATASALAEELEEQARLYFLLQGRGRALSDAEVATLRTLYQPVGRGRKETA